MELAILRLVQLNVCPRLWTMRQQSYAYCHQMIHTDFKPENVVICLRDDEVKEISKTGQLTTTKMGKNDIIKNMNMKVAGTLASTKEKDSASKEKSDSEC